MRFTAAFLGVLLAVSAPLAGAETFTDDKILDGLNFSAEERERLARGEIVAFSGEAYESTPRELAADATVLVHRSMDDILEAIKEVPSIIPQKYLVEYLDVSGPEDFAGVHYNQDELAHADELLKAKVGKDFNFSNEEIGVLRKHGAGAGTPSSDSKLRHRQCGIF